MTVAGDIKIVLITGGHCGLRLLGAEMLGQMLHLHLIHAGRNLERVGSAAFRRVLFHLKAIIVGMDQTLYTPKWTASEEMRYLVLTNGSASF